MKFYQLLAFLIILNSCAKGPQQETEVYANDFEAGGLEGITNGKAEVYNSSQVLGRYNSEEFILRLDNLPNHDLVRISFDLNIHDSWDGNQSAVGGPDIWELFVDGAKYISTTFSNANCPPGTFCPPQSYPMNYPNHNNNPRNGATQIGLPKACPAISDYGTSTYRIEKLIRHSAQSLQIKCLDKLVQMNTDNRLCDESWSVDNIRISTILLQ